MAPPTFAGHVISIPFSNGVRSFIIHCERQAIFAAIIMNQRTGINGKKYVHASPTLGSRTDKEQNRSAGTTRM